MNPNFTHFKQVISHSALLCMPLILAVCFYLILLKLETLNRVERMSNNSVGKNATILNKNA